MKSNSVPNSEADFNLTCTHCYFDGKSWMKLERREKGFSEFDDFRDRKLFP